MNIISRYIKTILLVIIAVSIISSSHLTIFAASKGQNTYIKKYFSETNKPSTSVTKYFDKISSKERNDLSNKYCEYAGSDGKYYYIKEAKEEQVASVIRNINRTEGAADEIKEITDGLNISADTDSAVIALSGFAGFVSTALGILVILISIGMTIFSGLDICYIAFPVFRNKCDESKQAGGIMASSRVNKQTGETKLRFVSDDAQYSVVAADVMQTGKNPFVIYFGRRILSYVILAVLVYIIFTGRITIFTGLALKAVSGILQLMSAL